MFPKNWVKWRAQRSLFERSSAGGEKKGETQTIVAIAYTGLLGLIIDPKEQEPEPIIQPRSDLGSVEESVPTQEPPLSEVELPKVVEENGSARADCYRTGTRVRKSTRRVNLEVNLP